LTIELIRKKLLTFFMPIIKNTPHASGVGNFYGSFLIASVSRSFCRVPIEFYPAAGFSHH